METNSSSTNLQRIHELETTQAKLESNNRELRSMSNQP